MSLTISERDLERARGILGLELPVEIVLCRTQVNPLAYWTTVGESHEIVCNSELEKLEANFVIWHELGHAQQYEKYGDFFQPKYAEQVVDAGFDPGDLQIGQRMELDDEQKVRYYNIPFEKEASEIARTYCDLYEVVV